ncbi:hypothetical protein NX059_007174 [Plenodomus lindquistii]|nr:hypothetical protein NX059_007174 [Plenodomus lindquistii]
MKTSFEKLQKYTPTTADLPEVRFVSDLLWLYWAGGYMSHSAYILKYICLPQITSRSSRQMIASAFRNRGVGADIPLWPGVEFNRDDEAGKALIGSLGMAYAHLLFTHKGTLGLKHIRAVQVFRDKGAEWYPQVILHVENVPAQLLIPQELPDWQPGPQDAQVAAHLPEARSMNGPSSYQRDANGNYFRVHELSLE